MDQIEKLAEYFKRFPGIGERQAKRFVYHILREHTTDLENLITAIRITREKIHQCQECFRFAETKNGHCSLCEKNRDAKILIVVEKDSDLIPLQKCPISAKYFVLGSRQSELLSKLKTEPIEEVILAFSVTPQSEYNEGIIREKLRPFIMEKNIKLSSLGRGLSTGLELEYSDTDTIENALKNRQ